MATEAPTTATSRPLSPHLQIYRMPLTAGLMSISHRITGVALTIGTLLLSWWVIAGGSGPEAYEAATGFIGSFIGQLMLIGWAAALYYHLFNGIRHLGWDVGYGYDLETATKSGHVVLVATAVATGLSFVVAWIIW